MNNLPLAALLATEAVERQFEPAPVATTPPARPGHEPVWRTRAAVAGAFAWAARMVAPAGYHLAH